MNTKSFSSLMIFGIFFTIILGTLLHFAYDFSSENPLVGIFTPVSESVWEHLKLGFYSFLIFSILFYKPLSSSTENYLFAVALSSLALNIFIVLVFYTYTSFTGHSILWVDITTYILSCILALFLFHKLLSLPPLPKYFNWIGAVIILGTIVLMTIFTFNPPALPIFTPPVV